jgi:hypothetical protein
MSSSEDDVMIVVTLLAADEDEPKKKRKETFGYIPLTKKGNSLAKLFADLLADEKKIFPVLSNGI